MLLSIYIFIHFILGVIVLVLILQSPVFASRELMLIVSYVVFYILSNMYYRFRRSITPSYLLYLLVIFIAGNISVYSFIYNKHIQSLNTRLITIPRYDHYTLYFIVFIVVSIIFAIYLLKTRKYTYKPISIKIPTLSVSKISHLYLLGVFSLLLFAIIGLPAFIILIPLFMLFTLSLITNKDTRKMKRYIPSYIFLLLVILVLGIHRYILLQFAFPIFIFSMLTVKDSEFKMKKLVKVVLIACSGLILISLYGVISEFYKLNTRFDSNLSLSDFTEIFNNFELLTFWVSRQLYRVFTIWSHLGGNIIEYTDINGFFYGLSYIKPIAPLLGLPYVSLPVISATLISASYAQPGLLAEGYANFGIVGAIINILVVLFLIEKLYINFINKNTVLTLLLITIPTTQVLMDGGSLNSIIALILVVYVTIFPIKYEKNITNK